MPSYAWQDVELQHACHVSACHSLTKAAFSSTYLKDAMFPLMHHNPLQVVFYDQGSYCWEAGPNRPICLSDVLSSYCEGSEPLFTCYWGHTATTPVVVVPKRPARDMPPLLEGEVMEGSASTENAMEPVPVPVVLNMMNPDGPQEQVGGYAYDLLVCVCRWYTSAVCSCGHGVCAWPSWHSSTV